MKRGIRCILAGSVAAIAGVRAGYGDAPAVTADASFVSQYLFRGQRLGGPAFQPSVEADGPAWALGVWGSTPLSAKVPGQSDPEIDPYGSYLFALSPALSAQPGITLYTYKRAPTDRGFYRLTYEPNLAVLYTVRGFRLVPKVYYDPVLDGATGELSAAYAVPLADLGSEVDFSGTAGAYRMADYANHAVTRVAAWGQYWQLGASAPVAVGMRSKIVFGLAYEKGTDGWISLGSLPKTANPEVVGRGVATVTYALRF